MKGLIAIAVIITLGYFLLKKALGFAKVFAVVFALVALVYFANSALGLGLF